MSYPRVTLTQPLDAVLQLGHPWIFADALRHDRNLPTGAIVDVYNRDDQFVARGVLEPDSHLRLRVWTLRQDVAVDEQLLEKRIRAALKRRSFPNHATNGFRLLNGEGDRIPGLVCDIYDKIGVLRPDGLAAEQWIEPARRIIEKLLPIQHWAVRRSEIYRQDNPAAMWLGTPPAAPELTFLEHDITFVVDPINGQKTGFFLDQRANRQRIARLAPGKRVLNLFSYTGGFSVAAAMNGAARTTTVDIAKPAVDAARHHFTLNGLAPEAHEFIAADVFDYLETLAPQSAPFEIAICDPPSFAHKRQDFKKARTAYVRLFSKLLQAMPTASTVALASCSSHIDRTAFVNIIAEAAQTADCSLVLSGVWGADTDHTTLPAFPEGDYLQFALATITRD